MSSIFSDPPFGRGQTYLAGATATQDANSNYIEGTGVAGEIKVFQDIDPGSQSYKSNRLVYCLAVRVAQSSKTVGQQCTDITAGTVVKLAAGKLDILDASAASAGLAAYSDVASQIGQIGVVDEYLKAAPNAGDIIWLVVKGPTTVKATTTATSVGVWLGPSSTAGSFAAGTTPAAVGNAQPYPVQAVALEAKGAAVLTVRANIINAGI